MRTAELLRRELLTKPAIVVTDVPYTLEDEEYGNLGTTQENENTAGDGHQLSERLTVVPDQQESDVANFEKDQPETL
jgi:hypothetical protein